MCIIYQVIDDFLDVGSQRIVVKGTACHLFRYRELYFSLEILTVCTQTVVFECLSVQQKQLQ